MLREELQLLQEQGSYVGEVVKPMDKKKVLVKVHVAGLFLLLYWNKEKSFLFLFNVQKYFNL